jgi:50S ribosomal subunit-associated GTPase HflX
MASLGLIRIGERRDRLKQMLKEVQRTRSLHRAARQRHAFAGSCGRQLPVVAVVGYTNAVRLSIWCSMEEKKQGRRIILMSTFL